MQLFKNKYAAISIALFLMISMAASMMLLPNANAHTPKWNIPTYAYITAAPNPIGVNQTTYIIMWLDKLWDNTALTNNYRFHNYKLVITAPNGVNTTENFPVVSDPTSDQDYAFTPTTIGTYVLTFIFPGQTITTDNDFATLSLPYPPFSEPNPYIGDYYEPNTVSMNLTVQSTPITAAITSEPLPMAYWTRPIYGENTNWYTLASNWLGSGVEGYAGWGATGNQQSYPGDAVGSLTSHVMWTKPLQSGGIVGGNTVAIPGNTYFEGSAYSQRYTNPIIVDGLLIYNGPIGWSGVAGAFTAQPYGSTTCVDLQTGKVIWTNSAMPAPTFAYVYDAEDPNQHGVWPPVLICSTAGSFLGTSFPGTWEGFDADTGTSIFNVTNVPGGVSMLGPHGEYLVLNFVNYGPVNAFGVATGPLKWYLQEWNSSRLWDGTYSGPSTVPSLIPQVTNGAWTGGYMNVQGTYEYVPSILDFNISMPTLTTAPVIYDAFYNNMLICENGTYPGAPEEAFSTVGWSPYTYFGVNMKAGSIGSVLWYNTVAAPAGNITVEPGGADPTANSGHGVFTEVYKETRQWVGYSMATGKEIWGPTPSEATLDYYGNPAIPILGGCCAYGNLYSTGYAGTLYSWNLTTGKLEWIWGNGGAGNSSYAGFNTPFGVYPMQINAIGNGVVYMVTTEHTIETPLFKGAFTVAINATTGAQIWALSDYTGEFFAISYAMADGYNTWFNGYDNSIYVVGRGPSATTVSAPNVAVPFGTPVVIKGTVMDISTGTTQTQQAADFPHGVPCASDASMEAWMGYVYQQQAEPTDFTGVQVTLSVTDSNHNHYVIGTATTDESGTYMLTWTPIISGNFTVYANFAGTKGYWPSSAEDGFTVTPAPSATPAPTATPTSVANLYFVPAIVGLFVLIIVVAVVLAILVIRKRP